jgi:hypothetical protein
LSAIEPARDIRADGYASDSKNWIGDLVKAGLVERFEGQRSGRGRKVQYRVT